MGLYPVRLTLRFAHDFIRENVLYGPNQDYVEMWTR